MEEVLIISGVRTPIGAFQGALSSFSAPALGSLALRSAIQKANVLPEEIDEVIMGCVLSAGLGQAPARQASLGAGIPYSVPCTTINKVCGSGMKSIMLGAQSIKLGESQIVLAGGMESMSNAPYLLGKARSGYRMGHGELTDSMIHDGLWDPYKGVHMGVCGDATAEKYCFSREEIDTFSFQSYQKTLNAQQNQYFDNEITPVEVPQKKGEPISLFFDEEPSKADLSKLSQLRPAFGKGGTTTAGNASSINDGAAAVLLASSSVSKAKSLNPLGKIVCYETYAHEPEWFTTAPAYAIKNLLKKCNLSIKDIDLFEVNEAFAVVAMYTARKVRIPEEKMNVNGGAVAIGHPIGMTGTRLVITALHELRRRGGKYAIASPCIGGGEATAILLEVI